MLDRCVFYDNEASVWGGALYADNGRVIVRRCTFFNNSGGDGSTLRLYGGTLSITSSIFSWGRPTYAIGKTGAAPAIRNCLFFGNGNNGQNIFGPMPAGFGTISGANSNGTPCDRYANIFLNPLYSDTAARDFNLLAESPCINAGDSGLSRELDHSIADIGAHPHLLLPQALDRSQLPGAQLLPAWPNPFNPSTRLRFELPETARVSIRIFDISGRETAQLANAIYPSGIHEITWHAHAVSSGTYFALLESGSTHSIQKLLLLK